MRINIFFVLIILILNLEAKSFFSNDEQADSSIYIGGLKNLIIATQKTRGLTNSYLNGNVVAMLLVYTNRSNMKEAIGTMESLPLAADPVINNRATTISQSLIKLNNKAFKLKPNDAFSQYTEQIEQILMLAQTISKRSAKDSNQFGQEISSIMMETMLPMTEYVGQLRGFGSGLAAKKTANKNELEKTLVLSTKIQNLNTKLQIQMQELISKYSKNFSSTIKTELLNINKSTNSYILFTQSNFKNQLENVNPNTYFDNGTNLITSIIKAYDTNNIALLDDSKGWF